MSKGTILVSGVTGYIGAWVAKEFLDNGYAVRGTVRSLKSKKGQEHLDRWLSEGQKLELVEADLLDEESWVKACQGVDFVAHVASPFFIACKPAAAEEKLYKPAKQGTLNVLRAAQAAGVKKVVLTSSVAAIMGGQKEEDIKDKEPESLWSDINTKGLDPYLISKTIAEKAAWDFVKECKERGETIFELSTINPSFVLGPPVSNGSATSHMVPQRLLNGSMPLIPDLSQSTVDVRDVAKAHRLALESDAANGQRFLCSANNDTSFLKWAAILHAEFKQYGYRIPTHKAPYIALMLLAVVDKEVRALLSDVGKKPLSFSNNKIKNLLQMQFIDEKDMLISHLHGCIQIGVPGFHQTSKYKKSMESGVVRVTER